MFLPTPRKKWKRCRCSACDSRRGNSAAMPRANRLSHRPRGLASSPLDFSTSPDSALSTPPPTSQPARNPPRRSAKKGSATVTTAAGSNRQLGSGHVLDYLAPPWPFSPQDTALIRAGYRPAFKPPTTTTSTTPTTSADSSGGRNKPPLNDGGTSCPCRKAQGPDELCL